MMACFRYATENSSSQGCPYQSPFANFGYDGQGNQIVVEWLWDCEAPSRNDLKQAYTVDMVTSFYRNKVTLPSTLNSHALLFYGNNYVENCDTSQLDYGACYFDALTSQLKVWDGYQWLSSTAFTAPS